MKLGEVRADECFRSSPLCLGEERNEPRQIHRGARLLGAQAYTFTTAHKVDVPVRTAVVDTW